MVPLLVPLFAPLLSRRQSIVSLVTGALTIAGCGGGGVGGSSLGAGGTASEGGPGAVGVGGPGDVSVAGVSSGGTGSLSVGSVTGFGSIIVNGNGVRIDDSAATVTDEDGVNMRGNLKLGMQVIVTSSTAVSGAVTAQSVVVGGELQGRVEQIDLGGKSFTVLGQKVLVLGSTVFDAASSPALSGLAGLALNDIVEVHGFLDAKKNELTTTFVQRKASVSHFKIQGEIRLKGATKLEIGGLKVDFATATGTPADRAVMRIRLAPAVPPLPTEWTATLIRGVENLGQNRDLYEIEARISDFTSATSFKVNGLPVNASNAAVVFIPNAAALLVGVRVEVKGTLTGGTLFATQIKVESDNELETLEYELHGAISGLSGMAVPGSFELLGSTIQTILFDNNTVFVNGTATNLANGRPVEVKGTATSGVAGTVIAAKSIKFE